LFLSLITLFIYTTFYQPDFSPLLAAVLTLGLGFLLIQRRYLKGIFTPANLKRQSFERKTGLLKEEILKETQKAESLRKKIFYYSRLKTLLESLKDCFSLAQASRVVSSQVNHLFDLPELTTTPYIFHAQTGELGISFLQKGQMQINLKAKKGDAFDQWVVKTMRPLLVEDTHKDFRFDRKEPKLEEPRAIRSLISVPLMVADRALGILRVDSPKENQFTVEDLRFLLTIGELTALALENAQLYERVEGLALKDSLTGLYLRKHLLERMTEEIQHLALRKPFSFLMIDLDHFKDYNDRFGHIAGDAVLRCVAMLLADSFPEPGNVVCRYGGEEFCVLLLGCPQERAVGLAEEFREKVESQTMTLRRQKTHVTVSIGVASFPEDARDKEDLIHRADQFMYQAKRTGRNKVCA